MRFVTTALAMIPLPCTVWGVLNMHIEMMLLDSASVIRNSVGEDLAVLLSPKPYVTRFAMAVEDHGHGIVMPV
jgi:hypothetical protein